MMRLSIRRALVVLALLVSVLTTASVVTAPAADAGCELEMYTSSTSLSVRSWGCYAGHRSIQVSAWCYRYGWVNYGWGTFWGVQQQYSLGNVYLAFYQQRSVSCAPGYVIGHSVRSSYRSPSNPYAVY